MNLHSSLSQESTGLQAGGDEILGWIGGAGFTFLLFFGMAHFEHAGADESAAEIADLRMVSMPLDPPPPPPRTTEPMTAPADMPPFAGIEVAASESPVRIAVVPPDLQMLVQATPHPPRALVPFRHFHTEFKPQMEVTVDPRHVYRTSEVDQPPVAINRVVPPVPKPVFGDAAVLRVVLLVVIEPNGAVSSARVSQSSGQSEFDKIVVETVINEWEFTPAIRRGKKVRCLAQQNVRVRLGAGSPFEIP
jgi:TonB family protein